MPSVLCHFAYVRLFTLLTQSHAHSVQDSSSSGVLGTDEFMAATMVMVAQNETAGRPLGEMDDEGECREIIAVLMMLLGGECWLDGVADMCCWVHPYP